MFVGTGKSDILVLVIYGGGVVVFVKFEHKLECLCLMAFPSKPNLICSWVEMQRNDDSFFL